MSINRCIECKCEWPKNNPVKGKCPNCGAFTHPTEAEDGEASTSDEKSDL